MFFFNKVVVETLRQRRTFMGFLSESEIDEIHRAIYTRYGIDFTNYEISSLQRRIARLMRKFHLQTALDLWRKFLYEKDFIYEYVQEIAVGNTELFRNPSLWKKLKSMLSFSQPFQVWHAGCATGEEVFTMAIVLQEIGLLPHAQLYGTDMNPVFIQKAQAGKITTSSLTQGSENYQLYGGKNLLNYFHPHADGEFLLDNSLKKYLHFAVHHLHKENVWQTYEIIFCRNVLIYFDEKLKEKVLYTLTDALKPNGWLILGYYDVLPSIFWKILEVVDIGERIFRKK